MSAARRALHAIPHQAQDAALTALIIAGSLTATWALSLITHH